MAEIQNNVYDNLNYLSWLKYSNERDVLQEVLEDNFFQIFGFERGSEVSILDVGCGMGSAAQRLFNVLDKNGVSFKYRGVDPSEELLKKFEEDLKSRRRGLDFELLNLGFENIDGNLKENDLVMGVHSLYYINDNFKDGLEKFCSLGNRFLIVHHGERGINSIHEEFSALIERKTQNIISTCYDVSKALDEIGALYNMNVYETRIDLKPFVDDDFHSDNMIRFFLEKNNILMDEIEMVRKYIVENYSDYMPHDMGVIYGSVK